MPGGKRCEYDLIPQTFASGAVLTDVIATGLMHWQSCEAADAPEDAAAGERSIDIRPGRSRTAQIDFTAALRGGACTAECLRRSGLASCPPPLRLS